MFVGKRHSWYWYAFWALIFAAFVFGVSRFFLNLVRKDAGRPKRASRKRRAGYFIDELFV